MAPTTARTLIQIMAPRNNLPSSSIGLLRRVGVLVTPWAAAQKATRLVLLFDLAGKVDATRAHRCRYDLDNKALEKVDYLFQGALRRNRPYIKGR